MSKNSKGFSLIELLVVLGILGAITVSQLPKIEQKATDVFSKGIVDDIHRIQRASLRFYRDNAAWPATGNALVAGNYLQAGEEEDPWGVDYVLSVSGVDLIVASDVKQAAYASRVQGKVPRPSLTGTTISSTIDPPGGEAIHDAFYALDGSRPLTGNMNADGNSISNVDVIAANRFVAAGGAVDSAGDPFDIAPAGMSNLQNIRLDGSIYDTDNPTYYIKPSGTSNFNRIMSTRAPTGATDLTNKSYVDGFMTCSLSGNGYCTWKNRFTQQWGKVNCAGATATVTYPRRFTTVYSVNATWKWNANTDAYARFLKSYNTTQAVFTCRNSYGSFEWSAIGII